MDFEKLFLFRLSDVLSLSLNELALFYLIGLVHHKLDYLRLWFVIWYWFGSDHVRRSFLAGAYVEMVASVD